MSFALLHDTDTTYRSQYLLPIIRSVTSCLPSLHMSRTIDASTALRQLLDDMDLTQEQFARANDMGIATVNRWVNGKVRVKERKLAKAFSAVGADPRDYGINEHAPSRAQVSTRVPDSLDMVEPVDAEWLRSALEGIAERLSAIESVLCDDVGAVKSLEDQLVNCFEKLRDKP